MERVATAWEPRSGQCIEASEQRIAIICTVFRGLSGSSACHAVSMKNWLSRFRMGSNDADAQRAHNPQEAPRQMATAPSKNCILEVQEAHVFPSGVLYHLESVQCLLSNLRYWNIQHWLEIAAL